MWATDSDLVEFFQKIDNNPVTFNYCSRHLTLNLLNVFKTVRVHQGKVYSSFELNEYYLGKKVGMLSKTRKPFFFRSKKKRYVFETMFFIQKIFKTFCLSTTFEFFL